jgi:NADPH:quinone reductase-like Zn-dependent oxidoreductase
MGVPTAHEIEPERPGNILAAIGNLVDGGLLRPHVSHRFALENVADGHRQVQTARTVGKVAIIVRP